MVQLKTLQTKQMVLQVQLVGVLPLVPLLQLEVGVEGSVEPQQDQLETVVLVDQVYQHKLKDLGVQLDRQEVKVDHQEMLLLV
jgi:hypothetical protein